MAGRDAEPEQATSLQARISRVTASGESPDRTVSVTLTAHGPELTLRPGVADRHNEHSLTVQVAAAMREAVAAHQRASEQALDPDRPESPASEPPPDLGDTPVGQRRDRFARAVSELAVSATSRQGHVTVEWRGAQDVRVQIRPGTLRQLGLGGEARLAADLSAALATASGEYGQRLIEIHQRVYGPTESGRQA